MPKVTVWIREEDLDSWKSIKDRPAFIHNALNIKDSYLALPKESKEKVKEHLLNLPVNNTRFENGVCKIHGTPLDGRGKCLMKGCKYA